MFEITNKRIPTMKTQILKTIAAGMIALMIGANVNAGPTKFNKKSTDIKSYIENKLTYPDEAKKNLIEGFVVVAFHVEKDGSLDIEAINSNDSVFRRYIILRFMNLKWPDLKDVGKTLFYRFDFKLI